jgi:hypothetical protein
MSFPVGRHDAICDALGLIGQMVTTLLVGRQRNAKKKTANNSGYKPFANPTEMELYTSGGDDGWTDHLMEEGLADEKFSWRML